MSEVALRVSRRPVVDLLALRQKVLRPHQAVSEVGFPGDSGADAAHFAAEADGRVVGIATVWPESPPWDQRAKRTWRLRGMASDPAWRGRGVGRAVLDAVIRHVTDEGGELLWCNARLSAVGFYEKAGFSTRGEIWEEPVIGPHVAMERPISAVP